MSTEVVGTITKVVLLPLIVLFLAGCAVVKIQQSDGEVLVERSVGFVSVHVSPGKNPIISESTTIGLAHRDRGFSVGYFQESLAAFPDSCHLILWVENEQQIETLKDLVGDLDHLCIWPYNKEEQL